LADRKEKLMRRYSLLIVGLMLMLGVSGQDGRIMTSFVPRSNAYDIYYPKNFLVYEDSAGIVTMTDTSSGLEITISAHSLDKKIDDEKLIQRMNEFLKGYFNKELKREDWNSYNTKFDALVECKITDAKANWVWYGVTQNSGLIVISMNKKATIGKDEMELIQYMINSLIIGG
jgi:hypothetical protein